MASATSATPAVFDTSPRFRDGWSSTIREASRMSAEDAFRMKRDVVGLHQLKVEITGEAD